MRASSSFCTYLISHFFSPKAISSSIVHCLSKYSCCSSGLSFSHFAFFLVKLLRDFSALLRAFSRALCNFPSASLLISAICWANSWVFSCWKAKSLLSLSTQTSSGAAFSLSSGVMLSQLAFFSSR